MGGDPPAVEKDLDRRGGQPGFDPLVHLRVRLAMGLNVSITYAKLNKIGRAKLEAMAEGARLATKKLWGR